MPVGCEDKDAIVAYLYDEMDAGERARIEAHLASCGACRAEVTALRAVRIELPAWAPPERDLGFAIVDRAQEAAPARRWTMPAWGLAAAAMLVLAAAAAIANLEVSYGADGFSVRTGWSRGQDVQTRAGREPAPAAADSQAQWRAELTSLEQRLREELGANETRAASTTPAPEPAEVLRRVRTLIGESETRQQRELALRLAEVLRDFDRQRQTDLVRIQYGLGQLERSSAADREMVNHLVRVSSQR
ncbi:MAG: anti-sigma factor family protein [Vicinamibacterales bacterium]